METTMNRFLAVNQRRISLWLISLAAIFLAGPVRTARAGITPTGDVEPANPSSWTTSTTGYIGNTASGTLTVDGGSGLISGTGCIGFGSGALGVVNVDGAGSTWINSGILYVGNNNNGSGTLSIAGGGTVTDTSGNIGYNFGSTGVAAVDGTGSKWTNSSAL